MNPFEQGTANYLSEQQRQSIKKKHIGIGGAGGLGSNIAVLLVRSGFTHFEIIDHDIIEPSNLNRQHYNLDDLARPKVHAIKEHLLKINPSSDITTHQIKWTISNANHFFTDCDFVIEAFDAAKTKQLFVEHYQTKASYVISGSGLAGRSSVKILQIKKLKNIYIVGDYQTAVDEKHPPLAPRVTQCAAIMAGIVLNLSLNNAPNDP